MSGKVDMNRTQLIDLSMPGSSEHASSLNTTKCIRIKFKILAVVAYSYLLIPIFIFFISWLRWYIGVTMAICLLTGFIVLVRSDYLSHRGELVLPLRSLLLIALAFLIWHWLAGQGGFFYQTADHHSRNAVFRDLINFPWPVIYPITGNALVYYIMHWIVPALFGKLFGWLGGNIALLLWTYVGSMLSYLLVVYLCRAFSINKMLLVGMLFMTWSGLDGVGMVIMTIFRQGTFIMGNADEWLDHVNATAPYGYQYSSNDTLLSWVYNQAIAPWIAVPLFLENRKVRNFAFLGLCIFPFAPLPFFGLAILMIASAVFMCTRQLRQKQYLNVVKDVFSVPNLSAVFSIFIVFWLYFKGNTAGQSFSLYTPLEDLDLQRIVILALFCMLEFGLYMITIHDNHKKDILFWIIGISLTLIPLFKVGFGRDFCMRASIPSFFALMILVIRYAIQIEEKSKTHFARAVAFIIILTIGVINPILGVAGKIAFVKEAGGWPIVADNIVTFSDKVFSGSGNDIYLANVLISSPENTVFYKHLAKQR